MAYITPIGPNPEQLEYRLGGGHGCDIHDRAFSYRTTQERPLRWIGRGLAETGICAGTELTDDQFDTARTLMRGQHPVTGEQLVEPKVAVPRDAKLPLSPLVRAIHGVAHEAGVPLSEVLGHQEKLLKRFAAAERALATHGETARLRADEAGELADAANAPVSEIWGEDTYARAAANLWTIHTTRSADGTVEEVRVPRRTIVGNLGYDITSTLPKSDSVLTALAPAEFVETVVEPAFLDAVQRAYDWLEDTTCYVMRGHHGDGKTADILPGNGYLGWQMIHRAARPTADHDIGDPHWHVHITIANMTHCSDGKWSTVAAGGRDLMRHAAAYDHITKALVRHNLHQAQPGIRYYRNTRTGAWEIAGITDATLRAFSHRNREIKDTLTAMGIDPDTASREQQRIAEQRSRQPKNHTTLAPDATLQDIWQAREHDAGRDPAATIRRVLHGGIDPLRASTEDPGDDGVDEADRVAWATAPDPTAPVDIPAIATALQDPETGLTAHGRRFSRADALARVADALPYGATTPTDIEVLTDLVLRQAGFIALNGGGAPSVQGPPGERADLAASHMANADRYTTHDVVDTELVILQAATNSHPEQSAVRITDTTLIDMAIDTVQTQHHLDLDDEQRAAVTRLLTQGRALDTVQGGPGTGKTTIMRALRVALSAAGYVVAGTATAALAAQVLHTESGIPARTVATLLTAADHGHDPLAGIDVLVIDEGNLLDDRDRAALYRLAAASATRIIEIGDQHQLRGVGVGSLFGRIHDLVGGSELHRNRRQRDQDERNALAAWRTGRYHEALTLWADKGHLVATHTAADATAAMLAQWWELRCGAPDPHTQLRGLVMLAATNAAVRRLNDAAQALRHTAHELGPGRSYYVAGGETIRLHVGDHVLLRINDEQHTHTTAPVLNGYRGIVTAIDEHGEMTVEWRHDTLDGHEIRTATVSPDYVALGGLTLGYSVTIHKSEGGTIKATWPGPEDIEAGGTVLVDATGADNPGLYVALSRHTRQVRIFGSLDQLENASDHYLLGPAHTRADLTDRTITALANQARDTETHADDIPVIDELGLIAATTVSPPRTPAGHHPDAIDTNTPAESQVPAGQRAAERVRRAHVQAEREQRDQHRQQTAAHWLRATWTDDPDLVERITTSDAFRIVARNLADAAESGFDVDEILTDIPTDRVRAAHVDNPAAYTAALIDVAVHRIRTGDTAATSERDAARREFELLVDQAGDLLRDAWGTHPELAEAVIDSPAFPTLARALDGYVDADLDVPGLLAAVPPAKVSSRGRDKGTYALYLLRQVAERQLADRHAAHTQAREQAERAHRHHDLARLAREVWSEQPDAAARILTGPSARWLLDTLDQADAAGQDIRTALAHLDLARLTAPDIPNPSGAATFALRRILDAQPVPHADPAAAGSHEITADDQRQPTAGARQPAVPDARRPVDAGSTETRDVRPAVDLSADPTERPFARTPDADLRQLLDTDRARLAALAAERATAEHRAHQLREAATAEQGPQITALESHRSALREQVAQAAEADRLHTDWQTALGHARAAAQERAAAEQDNQIRRGGRVPAEQAARITELRAAEDHAGRMAAELAQRAAQLQQHIGDSAARKKLQHRAAAVERDYPHARELAQRQDLAAADAADRQLARLTQRYEQLHDRMADMTAELDLRQQTLEAQPALDETQPTVNDERVPSEAMIEPHEFTMVSEIDPSIPEVEP